MYLGFIENLASFQNRELYNEYSRQDEQQLCARFLLVL